MTREQAAGLLGVPPDAAPDQVRQAWRTWARLAHPDLGGDAAYFDRVRSARDVLLAQHGKTLPTEPAPTSTSTSASTSAPTQEPELPPRLSWSQVLRAPHPREALVAVLLAMLALGLAALPSVFDVGEQPLRLAIAAAPAAVAAAGWSVVLVNRLLASTADVGHRITALTAAWLPIFAGQFVVAQIAGTSLLPVLPVLALPFVAAIAMVNPGAGLRPRPFPR